MDETCRDEFKKYLDEAFGENNWKLDGNNYSDYNLSTIPKNISVPIIDSNQENFLGRADIVNSFEIEEDVMTGIRYGVAVPFKIQIYKIKINDKICMQCSATKSHQKTLHNKKGCIVFGCGCKVANLDD